MPWNRLFVSTSLSSVRYYIYLEAMYILLNKTYIISYKRGDLDVHQFVQRQYCNLSELLVCEKKSHVEDIVCQYMIVDSICLQHRNHSSLNTNSSTELELYYKLNRLATYLKRLQFLVIPTVWESKTCNWESGMRLDGSFLVITVALIRNSDCSWNENMLVAFVVTHALPVLSDVLLSLALFDCKY